MAVNAIVDVGNGTRRGEELRHFVLLVIRRRWWIVGITFASVLVAAVLALLTARAYEARVTLVPAGSEGSFTAMSNALGQFGGVAELAGLQGARNPEVVEAIAVLQSRQFTESFIRDEHLMPELFQSRWDARAGRWKSGVTVPDLWAGYHLFDKQIRFIDQDDKTGIVTLRIDWRNPVEAAAWANELVKRVNSQMQQRALSEAEVTLQYLNRELQTTRIASVQNALQDLIEENLKREALANVRSDYVFRVVDPADPPDPADKIRPHRLIYLITGAFFGVMLSMLFVMGLEACGYVQRCLRESRPQD